MVFVSATKKGHFLSKKQEAVQVLVPSDVKNVSMAKNAKLVLLD